MSNESAVRSGQRAAFEPEALPTAHCPLPTAKQ
jgi:hypothetical protein